MKKILLSTTILVAFALSILLFDISCKKTAEALSNNTTVQQQNKIIYQKDFYGSGSQLYDYGEIWTANSDGTNQQKLNIILPANMVISLVEPKISPDGKSIYFDAFLTDGKTEVGNWDIYSCNIDGSNVYQVISDVSKSVTISTAY
jgi:Tol biopolymer transport system component